MNSSIFAIARRARAGLLPLVLLAASPAAAQTPPFPPLLDRQPESALRATADGNGDPRAVAVAWHGLAGYQVSGAAHQAVELFDALSGQNPNDAVMQAYLGSALIMKGRDQSFLPARLHSLQQGVRLLNGAAGQAPGDYTIRALRAATTINLPALFVEREMLEGDLRFLKDSIASGRAPHRSGSATAKRVVGALAWVCFQRGAADCAKQNLAEFDKARGSLPELAPHVAAMRESLRP